MRVVQWRSCIRSSLLGGLLTGLIGIAGCASTSDITATLPDQEDGTAILPKPVRVMERRATVDLQTPLGVAFRVETETLQAKKFTGVVPQQYDFSCGAAAVATLLTYHYGIDTEERVIFETMYRAGDADKIRQFGFSLLDMKGYLETIGIASSGFSVTIDELQKEGVPAIQLINLNGYLHFVVIKGMNETEVLVGDPAGGLAVYPLEVFDAMREGDVAFVLTDLADIGRASFRREAKFRVTDSAFLEAAYDADEFLFIDELHRPAPDEFIFQAID